jgi:multimeric flavodoxin WrbA
MRILAILGSPRANGNTDTLTHALLDGAAAAGCEVETIALRELSIRPCVACEQCWETGAPCIIDDDMGQAYEAIARADLLVFATPVYWYAPTAIMKAFMDRLVPLNRPRGRPLIDGKAAVAVVAYEETGPTAAEPLLRMLELSFAYLGLRFVDRVVVDGVGPADAVRSRPHLLEQAREVGRRLRDLAQ